MGFYYLDLALPWSGLQEEDRRFRWILLSTLGAFAVIGVAVTSLSVPATQGMGNENLPPRIVSILDPGGGSAPTPSSAASAGAAGAEDAEQAGLPQQEEPPRPRGAPPKAPASAATEPQPASGETRDRARQAAASTGVLAFADALRELREAPPRVAPASSGQGSTSTGARGGSAAAGDRTLLQAGLSRGSGGIDGDVSGHGDVLGSSGLLAGEGESNGAGEGSGAGAGSGLQRGGSRGGSGAQGEPAGRTAKERKAARSQEEIQEILDRNKSRMYALYNRELRRNPALQGKVVVNVTIAPSGTVTACTMVYSELGAASLEQKLILLIKGIDFGDKPGVPVVTTQVPIEFFPA